MKIKPEHFEYLKEVISAWDIEKNRENYRKGQFPRADVTKDVDMRYRWDLLHAAVGPAWVCDNLYPYLNDTHIDTALRRIVPKLEGVQHV